MEDLWDMSHKLEMPGRTYASRFMFAKKTNCWQKRKNKPSFIPRMTATHSFLQTSKAQSW